MISLQRISRRPTEVIKALVNMTYEQINAEEIGNHCYFRIT